MSPVPTDSALPVVVAVSAGGSDAAIRCAASESSRTGTSLHVVHVVDREDVSGAQAARTCFRAVERARELVDQRVPVTSELFHGDLLDGLLAVSVQARLVVLERPAEGSGRGGTRPLVVRLASRSLAPVLSVPSDWRGRVRGTVTVGVDDPDSCGPLLHEALIAAQARAARLQVVHVEPTDHRGDVEGRVGRAVAKVGPGFGDVTVEVRILDDGGPVEALVRASVTSELLVLGRHHPLAPRGSRLGPVARRVVRQACCPVLLLTPSASTSSADWVFRGALA